MSSQIGTPGWHCNCLTNPGTLRLGGRRSRMLLVLPPSCVPVVGWAHNTYCIAAGTCHCLAAAAAMIQSFIQGCKDQWNELVNLNKRQALTQGVNLGLVVTSALIIWKSLMLITGSESPVVVVLSGSMEPGFHRGDILFLNMGTAPIRTGEIVVFNLDGRDIPIVHRVIKVHERSSKDHIDILTKGDNNYGDDRLLYNRGQEWLHKHHIMGRAVGFLPYVGMITIVMNDYPWLKYTLILGLGLLVMTSKE